MQKISVSGPAELVTVVPYHLGFQPERSLVAICLQEKAIGLVARMDLVGGSPTLDDDTAAGAQPNGDVAVRSVVRHPEARLVHAGWPVAGVDELGERAV